MVIAEYVVWAIVHFGLWGLMLLAAAGLGHLFLRKYEFDSFAERAAFTLSLGLGLAALLIFILGISGLFYREVFLSLTIAGSLATVVHWVRSRRDKSIAGLRWKEYVSLRGVFVLSPFAIGFAYWGLLLLMTQYPPMQWDAISHHLPWCREFLANHRMVAVKGSPHPVMPALNHMLFTWGMALKDDILAQMIEHTFLMLTAVGLYSWGKREKRPLFGLAVAAFWLASPLVLMLGASAYVDICQVCFVFLGVYALRVFWDGGQSRWWYLAMALLALGAGVKLPGLFFIIIGSGLGLWVLAKHWFKSRAPVPAGDGDGVHPGSSEQHLFTWKALAWGWVIAFVILIPWYGFIFYHTGNPIWPTFPQYSRGEWGAPAVVENTNNWLKNAAEPRTLANFLMLPVDWIRYPSRFYAETNLTLFPLIVVWPIAWVFALWDRSVRWWTLWALGFTVYWFMFPHQLRYWLPALPFAGLALYESIRWTIEKISRSAILHTVVWLVLGLAAVVYAGRLVHGGIKVRGMPPIDAQQRETFVSMLSGYRGVTYINKQASADDTVCMMNASYLNYYLKPRVLDLFGLLQSNRLPQFHWPEDEQWMRWIESKNVNWIYVNYAYAPDYLRIPKRNIVKEPPWPDYELVYADSTTWVFRRKPVPPEVW